MAQKPPLGEFPYALTGTAEESRYLTWVRNHSNYMAVRGFLDNLRSAAVLVRGILVNWLTLVPWLLMLSLLLGYLYRDRLLHWNTGMAVTTAIVAQTEEATTMAALLESSLWKRVRSSLWKWVKSPQMPQPFGLTFTALGLAFAWTLLFPLGVRYGQIRGQRQSVARPGSDSSVKRRDRYERSFGGALLVIIAVFLLELLPWLVHGLHRILEAGWQGIVAVLVVAVVVLGGANKLLTGLGGAKKKLMLGLIALLGLLAPLLVVLYMTGFLVFGPPTEGFTMVLLGLAAGALTLAIFGAIFLGWLKGALKLGESFKLLLLLGGALLMVVAMVVVVGVSVYRSDKYDRSIELVRLHDDLAKIDLSEIDARPPEQWTGEKDQWTPEKSGELQKELAALPQADSQLAKDAKTSQLADFHKELVVALEQGLGDVSARRAELPHLAFGQKFLFVLAWAFLIGLFCWLAVDVNQTSVNGLYRDRLASAYLVGRDTEGEVDIEEDVNLSDICQYEAGSTAPYHLVNVALNLQGSKDLMIRDRNSDFFVFSKRFIGGRRTGYCRTETLEQVHPQMNLATAMAISAAAASPNMGRGTNPGLVAFMTLLNVRLGYWLPNPGRLERKRLGAKESAFTFEQVFEEELVEIARRREQIYSEGSGRPIGARKQPTTEHGLVGIGYSGGGIRSATINLGISQALHGSGLFDHVDYMSTVSGGGYLGSSISTLMRYRTEPVSEIDGTVSVKSADQVESAEQIVTVTKTLRTGPLARVLAWFRPEPEQPREVEYRYPKQTELEVGDDDPVQAGQRLIKPIGPKYLTESEGGRQDERSMQSLGERFHWRVRPWALVREMRSKLDESWRWVNLSDGGHIENLAGIELLRRRCKYIILGDGEADPGLSFNGLATLMRYARMDLGIEIEIDLDNLRLQDDLAKPRSPENLCSGEHWAIGRITYPPERKGGEPEEGHLLYLKSSFSGDEDAIIKEYRHNNPDFPHESTADQFFDEGQFEAYRSLGQHIADQALKAPEVVGWITELSDSAAGQPADGVGSEATS